MLADFHSRPETLVVERVVWLGRTEEYNTVRTVRKLMLERVDHNWPNPSHQAFWFFILYRGLARPKGCSQNYFLQMNSHNALVYSTDPSANRRCAKCRNIESACTCPKQTPVGDRVSAVLRLEKAHRGGKVVTIIDRLPRSEPFLKDLAAELKKKCGCGGTYRLETQYGVIEIQGDRRETLRDELQRRGIRCKG